MDEQDPPKKKNLFLRALAFLITLALVLGAVFVVANRNRFNLDSLKRYVTYRSLERSDTGQAEPFAYSSSSTDVFAALGEDLLVCSAGGVRLYSASGVCYVEDAVILNQPAVDVGGGSAAVYSLGGDTVYLYRGRERLAVLSGFGGAILSARLNSSGWLAVVTQESGYKAVITIYDSDQVRRMAFRLSSAFVTDAVVTQDCKSLAVVSIGQDGTAFESALSLYTLPSKEDAGVDYDLSPASTFSLGNNVCFDLKDGGTIWLAGDAGIAAWTGSAVHSWSAQDRHLKGCALSGNFAAVLVGKYLAGSQADLITVSPQGEVLAELSIGEQVLSLSAAGKYIAVLTAGRLDVYTQDLALYATLEDPGGVRKVLMRGDGTAFLVGSGAAQLFVPD